jgi:hypothetical protein
MLLKTVQVADPVYYKLQPNQLPARMPFLSISGKDTVAQKRAPMSMKRLAFAVVGELGCEDGFDVFGV